MFEIVEPKQSEANLFSRRLSKLADRAWLGYSVHNYDWRLSYYSNFLNSKHGLNSYRILSYKDLDSVEQYDIGFVSILPLEKSIAGLHMQGKISQYSLSKEHLKIHTRSKSTKTHHYFQSLWMEKTFRESREAKLKLKAAILSLFEKQKCGWHGRDYVIYAETSFPTGARLAISQGLEVCIEVSAEDKPFYKYDSENQDTRIRKTIGSIWMVAT